MVEKKGVATAKTTIKLLRAADAQAIKGELAGLSGMTGASKTMLAVLKAVCDVEAVVP